LELHPRWEELDIQWYGWCHEGLGSVLTGVSSTQTVARDVLEEERCKPDRGARAFDYALDEIRSGRHERNLNVHGEQQKIQ
jgi:hypothetical protein